MSRIVITGGSGLLGLNWALARKNFDEVYLFLHKKACRSTALIPNSLTLRTRLKLQGFWR